jgi:mono/diheme cytochrome c family protein
MKTFVTVIITLASLAILLLLFIFSGIFNPGALKPHKDLTLWAINTTKDISIEKRAKKISVPYLDDTTMIQTGFRHYNEMCVMCHSAPGMDESEIAQGLYPHAPHIYKYAGKMDPKEIFWIVKNGIKMTGMPAFGPTHDDQKIWDITAFIKNKLGNMTPKEYKAWQKKYKGEGMDDDE